MPRRDGTRLYGGRNQGRINGCRRDDRKRARNRRRFDCQASSEYLENEQTLLRIRPIIMKMRLSKLTVA